VTLHRQRHEPVELDRISENFLIWEEEGYPQTGCVALHLTGRCDDRALEAALFRAMDQEPFFHARLDLAWQGGRHLFLWRFAAERPGLEVYDHTSGQPPRQIGPWFYDRMAPLLGRRMNLESEFPVRFQLHHLPEDRHLFMFVFHHAVCDAVRIFTFLRETFAGYHRLVISAEPPWGSTPSFHNADGNGKPAITPRIRYLENLLRDAVRYPLWRVAIPAGDGDGHGQRHMLQVQISDRDLLAAMRRRWQRDEGGLSDLLLAAIDLAVEEWNGRRGIDSDVMLNFLAVNQRGRHPDTRNGACRNPMGALPIPVGRQDRGSPELLLKSIIERRKAGLSSGLDVRFTSDLFGILGLCRRLPFPARKKLLYPLLTPRNTIFLSNAGVIWPAMDGSGSPTGDSAITGAGDLEILDVYLSLGCVRTMPLGMVAQTFRRKLYLEFLSWGNRFTQENVSDFSRLLLRKIAVFL
jgi:hypothetical protein